MARTLDEDEGYISPGIDLPSMDEEMSDNEPSSKRFKKVKDAEDTLGREEELALRMLRGH